MSAATILLIIMWIFAGVFLIILFKDVIAHKNELDKTKTVYNAFVSMVVTSLTLWELEVMPLQHLPGNSTRLCRMI